MATGILTGAREMREVLALALQAAFGGVMAESPSKLACTDDYGAKYAGLMTWVQDVCVAQLHEEPPAHAGGGPGSCENPECARLVARVADGCHGFFQRRLWREDGRIFRAGLGNVPASKHA